MSTKNEVLEQNMDNPHKKISDSEILPEFKYVHRISEIIWNDNENTDDNFKKIFKAIDSKKVSIEFVLRTVDYAATKRPKIISRYARLCFELLNKYGQNLDIKNTDIRVMLSAKGYFKEDKHSRKVSDVIGIFKDGTPQYYICWDRLEDLKKVSENQKVELDPSLTKNTLIDIAAKYGSSKCFKFLLENNYKITESTQVLAVEGGNKEILEILEKNNATFDNCYSAAVDCYRNDIADWISQKNHVAKISIAQCLISSNFRAASYCIANEGDINEKYNDECPLSVAIKNNIFDLVKFFVEKGADVNTMLYYIENNTGIFHFFMLTEFHIYQRNSISNSYSSI